MKHLTILLLFFWAIVFSLSARAQSGAISIKNQQGGAKTTITNFQVPNNSATLISPQTYLLEDGKDILTNGGFEHSTIATGWTLAAGTPSTETTINIDGAKSYQVDLAAQALSLYQDSTLYASQLAGAKIQGNAIGTVYKTFSENLYICPRPAGVSIVSDYASQCETVSESNVWVERNIPFLPGATSNGIEFKTAAAVTGTVYVAKAKVELGKVTANVGVVGSWIAFTPTGSWTANTTYTGKYRQVGENLEIQYNLVTAGAPTATPLIVNLPTGFTIDTSKLADGAIPSFDYKYVLASACNVTDGAIASYTCVGHYSTATAIAVRAQNSGSTYLASSYVTNLIPITFGATDGVSLTAIVPVSQFSGNSSTYSTNNRDTGWASCGHVQADFTGFGTMGAIETECKRQGSDLLMRGSATIGTPTAVEGRIAIKYGGASLTAKTFTSIQRAGSIAANYAASGVFGYHLLIESASTYFTFARETAAETGLTKTTGNILGVGAKLSFDARIPINNWTDSNIIIGSFNGLESCATTLECTDSFSASVTDTGAAAPVTAGSENVDWIQGDCTNPSGGTYTCTFKTGVFTAAPNCEATHADLRIPRTSVTSTAVTVYAYTTGAALSDSNGFTLSCSKAAADNIGKTAKAVASDQNDRTPGLTNVKTCMYSFAGATYATACTASPCTEYTDNCVMASPPTRSGTGDYPMTINAGTFANNSPLHCSCDSTAATTCFITGNPSFADASGGANLNNVRTSLAQGGSDGLITDSAPKVTCKGVAP